MKLGKLTNKGLSGATGPNVPTWAQAEAHNAKLQSRIQARGQDRFAAAESNRKQSEAAHAKHTRDRNRELSS